MRPDVMAGAQIGETLRQIGRLFSGGAVAGQSDAALLHRFVAARDEEAFAGLVARHGPMVLAVCRGVLRDRGDAEDAFQATFLVLVRRAGSIWVDDSLGGWLYRVARRVALRANADARRRKARERQGVEMDAIAGPDEGARDRVGAELHAEIARLPEAMRRALVLCDLEGMTQVEAARVLHCGEATLRRRLAGARERLRARLARHGVAPSAVAALLRPAIVPSGWAEAAVRAALASGRAATTAGRLAAPVAASMARARRLRVASALVVGVGLASAWAVAAGRDGPPEATAVQALVPKEAPPAGASGSHWVHVKYDTEYEKWVCLDDGRRLSKTDEVAVLEDPVAGSELRWDKGEDRITRRESFRMAGGERADGGALREMMTTEFYFPQIDEVRPGKTPLIGLDGGLGSLDYTLETILGRRIMRVDQFVKDPAGEVRLEKQTWVDLETKRPIRARERLVLPHQIKFKREFRTGTYEYSATGPADLVALGFPKGLPIVDGNPPRAEALPEGLRRALGGASTAIRRLPRDLRIVTEDRQLRLIYWSSPDAFLHKLANHVIDQEDQDFQAGRRPRIFIVSRDGLDQVGDDLRPAIAPVPDGDAPAELSEEKLAAIFSRAASDRIELDDGARAIDIDKGGIVEPGKPPRDQVLVRDSFPGPAGLPEPIAEQWPFTDWDRRLITVVDPEPGTPAGQVVLQFEARGKRLRWYCDPDHDFIAVRQVESHQEEGAWKVSEETRALAWKPLPGGTWYVSRWEVRGEGEDSKRNRRVEVTPLAPDGFPPGVFDSGKLLDAFKKAGAKIVVD